MASATALPRNRPPGRIRGWSKRLSLRQRILAVNIFALAILAGGIFYLDSFRSRLTQARVDQAQSEAVMIAHMLAALPAGGREPILVRLGRDSGTRLRLYAADGPRVADSWHNAAPTYALRDPAGEPWYRGVALWLDNAVDTIVGAPPPPEFFPPARDELAAWPEARESLRSGRPVPMLRRAADGTPYIAAAQRIDGADRQVLLLTVNARDIRRVVRAERYALFLILVGTLIVSILLSRFLARTIANPLRKLAHAAHRCGAQRARVSMCRRCRSGPTRSATRPGIHEIRRASAADRRRRRLRRRCHHELKNPLASLRSAVDTLERVEDPALRRQMLDVVRQDVGRLARWSSTSPKPRGSTPIVAGGSSHRRRQDDRGMVPVWRSARQTGPGSPSPGRACARGDHGDESRLAR